MFKLGSLFDGSGGFPLAGSLCGIEPVWASEVEPYPIAVTRSRFPRMKHLGDISKVNGAEIEPVDIVTFGSPCQDLSVAGKQRGIQHTANGDEETTRSGLFMEAVRIIKEMRRATNGKYPSFCIFENVPGAFSSNRGADFRVVLEEIAKVKDQNAVIPMPPNGKWTTYGCIVGNRFSIAWRVLDAQFWGVPQRRRRIYLVADFRGERALQILFEREGLRGYLAPSGEEGKDPTADAQGCLGADDRKGTGCDPYNGALTGDKAATIGVNCGLGTGRNGVIFPCVAVAYSHKPRALNGRPLVEQANTICATDYKDPDIVAAPPSYIVRRLTPTECARLQGFPDDWGSIDPKETFTEDEAAFWLDVRKTFDRINGRKEKDYTAKQMLQWYNALHTDSAEYKMWGNGIAMPCALYVMQGIADALNGVDIKRALPKPFQISFFEEE